VRVITADFNYLLGRTVFLDMGVFEVPHIRDWFRDFYCTPCPPHITPYVRGEAK